MNFINVLIILLSIFLGYWVWLKNPFSRNRIPMAILVAAGTMLLGPLVVNQVKGLTSGNAVNGITDDQVTVL